MKRYLIAGLIVLNAALLVALVFGTGARRAYGQAIGTRYLAMTGHIRSDRDMLYIVDLGKRRLAGWQLDRSTKKLKGLSRSGGRNLLEDFGRGRDR